MYSCLANSCEKDNNFLSLGKFYIDVDLGEFLSFLFNGSSFIDIELVESHYLQRPINTEHVQRLVKDFEVQGILRTENPGVVIGVVEGWMKLKNLGGHIYKISKNFPLLSVLNLSECPHCSIAQVIRGGHRTSAARYFSDKPEHSKERYWLYQVLVPGKFWYQIYHLKFSNYNGLKK